MNNQVNQDEVSQEMKDYLERERALRNNESPNIEDRTSIKEKVSPEMQAYLESEKRSKNKH